MKLSHALIGAAVVVGLIVWLLVTAQMPPIYLFTSATPVIKLLMLLLVLMFVVVAVLAVSSRSTSGADFLKILGLLSTGVGVLGVLYAGIGVAGGIRAVGEMPSLAVLAPGLAEGLTPLAMGLLVAAVAALPGEKLKTASAQAM